LEGDDFNKWIKDEEYQLAKKCTDKIGKIFKMEFPENEIAYVAVHLAGKKSGGKETGGSDNIVWKKLFTKVCIINLLQVH
jgi:lichenan operon transcriptional antiterminator